MNKPLVSVLMTSYNREKYIAQAIESVLSSTYSNFELIICDDVSTDKTIDIAKQYQQKDARVKVFLHETNLGDYPNRNRAASYATGKYLKYVDADDCIYPWGLEILMNCMERFPNAGWGLCSLIQNDYRIYPFELKPSELYHYNFFTASIFHKAPLSAIIKTDVFNAVGGFSGKQHLSDFELWHILGLQYNVVLMCDGIVWHRSHDEQESVQNKVNPLVSFKYYVAELNFMKECNIIPLPEEERKQVIKKLTLEVFKRTFINIKQFKFNTFLKLYKASKQKQYNFIWKK